MPYLSLSILRFEFFPFCFSMSGDLTPQLQMLLLLLLYMNQQTEESPNKKTDNSQGGKDHNNNNKTREKRKCYFCGIVGHVVNDCRKKKRKMSATCFHCGEAGHMARDCPKKQGQGPQAGPSGGTSLTSSPRCFVLSCLSSQSYLENFR